MNIVLCGMMGSGKTTIGIRLAELTVKWILQNPQPIAFAGAKYKR